ncbi:MAG: PorV/PorQ family protein [Ignavibacteriales bacterium]|nr:PorV/PorQ family protein [Ignavibacteriales bacterium]
MIKKTYEVFTTLSLCACLVFFGYSKSIAQAKVSTTAAQFLGISIGAHALGMGGTSVASAYDVSSIYYNPSAFSQSHKTQVLVSTTDWLVGSKLRWLGAMIDVDGSNAFGISITQLAYGEEMVTTENNPEGTGERWSAQDLAVAMSYSRNLTDRFSIGGSAKYISQSIWNESASTIAFDIGLLFVTGFHDMRLGMSIANFGGDMKMDGRDLRKVIDTDPSNAGSNKLNLANLVTDPWPIPLIFRVGLAMDLVKNETALVTIECDALRPSDNVEVINLGAEVTLLNLVSLRGGYKSLFQTDSEEGLTLGCGLKYSELGSMGLEVNYAYQQFGRFGNINTISVAVLF